jgi:hypothetical protein
MNGGIAPSRTAEGGVRPPPRPPTPASARRERESRSRRRRTALDWMAVAAEEHGREILEVYLQAMRGGDWRAAEALMSRIYGKPTETVVSHTPASPEKAVPASMTLEEKLELLDRLRAGEPVELP